MDDISICTYKATIPTHRDLIEVLGGSYELWKQIEDFVMEKYPKGLAEWNYPGKKYGCLIELKTRKERLSIFYQEMIPLKSLLFLDKKRWMR